MFNKIGSLRRTAVTVKVLTFEGIKSLPQVSEIRMGLNDQLIACGNWYLTVSTSNHCNLF